MPMIALTAYVMREQRAAIEHVGADGIIAKPILSIEKFGDDIAGFVHRRRRARLAPGRTAERAGPAPAAASMDRVTFDRLWASFDTAGRAELKARVTKDIGRAAAAVAEALRAGDAQQLRSATHVLIAVAGVIGAGKLQSLARRLNSAGHAGEHAIRERDCAELAEEAGRVLDLVSHTEEGRHR
jgi:CheY-like chemotaxis protein